jgi:hypothetical protein
MTSFRGRIGVHIPTSLASRSGPRVLHERHTQRHINAGDASAHVAIWASRTPPRNPTPSRSTHCSRTTTELPLLS